MYGTIFYLDIESTNCLGVLEAQQMPYKHHLHRAVYYQNRFHSVVCQSATSVGVQLGVHFGAVV